MSPDEAEAVYKAHWEQVKIEWEKVRVLSFFSVIAQRGTKTYKKPTDLFSFKWEEEPKEKGKRLSHEEAIKRAYEIKLKRDGKEKRSKRRRRDHR